MFAGKALRCDCGFEVRAYDDEAFVEAIRRHAQEAHGIDFSAELALDIALSSAAAPSEEELVANNGVVRKEKR